MDLLRNLFGKGKSETRRKGSTLDRWQTSAAEGPHGYCPLRITELNVDFYREDPRFTNGLEGHRVVPPAGFCSASSDPRFPEVCGRRPEHCSRMSNLDFCDVPQYGGQRW